MRQLILLLLMLGCGGPSNVPHPVVLGASLEAQVPAAADLQTVLRRRITNMLSGQVVVGKKSKLRASQHLQDDGGSGFQTWMDETPREVQSLRVVQQLGPVVQVQMIEDRCLAKNNSWYALKGWIHRNRLLPLNGTESVFRGSKGTGVMSRPGQVPTHKDNEVFFIRFADAKHPGYKVPVPFSSLVFSVPEVDWAASLVDGQLRDVSSNVCASPKTQECGARLEEGSFAAELNGEVVLKRVCAPGVPCESSGRLKRLLTSTSVFRREGRLDGGSALLLFTNRCEQVALRSNRLPLISEFWGSGSGRGGSTGSCLSVAKETPLLWEDQSDAGKILKDIMLRSKPLGTDFTCSTTLFENAGDPVCFRNSDLVPTTCHAARTW